MLKENQHPGQRLLNLRLALNLSQRELAKEFMVSSGAIASWEIGANPLPGPVIKLIELYENSISLKQPATNSYRLTLQEVVNSSTINDSEKDLILKCLNNYIDDESRINSIRAKAKLALIKKVLDFLDGSKGMTIKFVQLLSYLEIGLPAELRNALGNIQGKLKPLSKKIVTEILVEAYGKNWEDLFESFDMKPIAVTSLAQVHWGKLKSGGEVAIKIQDPNVKKIFETQFKKIELLSKVGGLFEKDLKLLFVEIKKLIEQECDYVQEVENQLKIKEILKDFPRVYISKVYKSLCRQNIIISEFVDGENLITFSQKAGQDSKNLVANAIVSSLTHLSFVHNLVYADVHFENFLVKNDKIVILDFGRIFSPDKNRMKLETMFYDAVIKGKKEVARSLFNKVGFAKDVDQFDFDEFWIFLANTSKHLLIDAKFKFDQNYLLAISREGRRFSQKKNMKLSPEVFWAFAFSSGTWAIFSLLEAELNWHQIAVKTFEEALKR